MRTPPSASTPFFAPLIQFHFGSGRYEGTVGRRTWGGKGGVGGEKGESSVL